MEISHLVVNGCSWTYCQGLDDPKTQGWPTLLANKLGCEVVNLAYPGSGNDGITRRTYEYVYENLPTNSKPLFVIGWTQYWRREAWYEKWYGNDNYDYQIVCMPNEKSKDPWEEGLLQNYNEEEFLRKTMLCKLQTLALFKQYNIPYIMTDFVIEYFEDETTNRVKNRFANMYKEFNLANDIDQIGYISGKYKPLPCKHDGPEAMVEFADTLYNAIIKKYNNINIQQANFLKLKNFPFRDPERAKYISQWE